MITGNELSTESKYAQAFTLSEDFRAALDNTAAYIYLVDPESYKLLYMNAALRNACGGERADCCYEAAGFSEPCKNCTLSALLKCGVSEPTEVRRADGRWMLSQASRIFCGGRILYLISSADITEQKRLEEALLVSAAERELILRRSEKYVFDYDIANGSAGELVDAFELLGLPRRVENFEEKLVSGGIVSPESTEACRSFFRRLRSGKPEGSAELRLCCGKESRWYHLDSITVFENRCPQRAIISFYDCSGQNERERAMLLESAAQDSMTGLLNHSAMEQRVEEQLSRASAGVRGAMLMIDIDNFKDINDTLGHQSGDEALVRAADIIRASFRDSDLVGRIGGDEFMVFIPSGIDGAGIRKKTAELLNKLNFSVQGCPLTASIGVAIASGRADFKTMYGIADRALYSAKRMGKNTFCVSDQQ